MKDSSKTKSELIEELSILKRKIERLEQSEVQQKQTESELAKSEHKYRQLAEGMPALICIFLPDSTLTYVNKAYGELFQKRPDDLIGRKFLDFFPDEKIRENVRRQYMSLTPENPVNIYEHEVSVADGSNQRRWYRWTDHAFFKDNGQISHFQSIGQDVTEHKRTQDVMRKNEAQYRLLAENATDVIWVVDLSMRLSYISPSVKRLLGLTVEEAMARTMRQAFTPLAFKKAMQIFTEEMAMENAGGDDSTRSRIVELELIRKDGSTVPVEGNFRFIRDPSGEAKGILAIIRDITERKRTEEALRESEALLRGVFKATPVGLCIVKDRVFQNVNKAFFEILGYSEFEIIGSSTRLLYENEMEYERVGRDVSAGISERGLACVQTKHRRKEGSLRDIALTVVPFQAKHISSGMMIVTVEDITDRKRAEEELQENRRQLADIIEFLPDATLVIDKSGKVIAWNRAMEAMTGVKKEDMIGKSNYEYALPFYGFRRPVLIDLVLHPDREIENQYTAIQRTGDILLGEVYTPNLPSGNIHVSVTASVLRDEKGEITAAIECIRDNTERKRLEERLNRAEKMEALGTLAGGVAHDLNNVLGGVVGYSELLRNELPDGGSLKKFADNIVQSGVRGAAIIQDLLTLARRGVTVSEVVDLNKLVVKYLRTPEFEQLKSHHPEVIIRANLEDKLLNVKGSPVHLNKMIMNLVSNAVEAISGRGEVTIRTENRYLDRPVHGYDKMQEGDYVVLKVSDTGTGICDNDRKKIFEPFYTKKVMGRSGTGLGLAVVWGTVKDHNGYIDVRSEEGKGSTFVVYIPVTRDEPAKIEKVIAPVAYMGRNESVLIVDDGKDQRELARSMMEKIGYQVEAVASGEEAIEYIKNHKVDLIVLDMIMEPGIDGTEAYQRIIEIKPGQKAILVSGFSETDRVRKAQEMGAGTFVQKPYILKNIGIAVRKELDRGK